MLQPLLFAAVHLLGLAVCLAAGPRARPWLCCALGFPIGLAALVLPLLALAAAGVPYGAVLVVAVAAAIAAGAALGIRRRGPITAAERRAIAWSTGALLLICIPFTLVNLSALTYDSHATIVFGRVLADDHGFGSGLRHVLGDRAPFLVVAHSLAAFIGADFLYALAPVLGLSSVAAFVLVLWHGFVAVGVAPRRRTAPIALVAGVLFTTYLVQFHVLYVHENLPTAIYLLLFAALYWLAEVEEDGTFAPVAIIALTAASVMRVENAAAACLFGALALLPSRLPRRPLAPWLAAFVVVASGWNLSLILDSPQDTDMKLTATRSSALMAAPLLLGLAWLASGLPALGRLRRHVPPALALLAIAGLVAAFATRHDLMRASAEAMALNLTSIDDWGLAWVGLALLLVTGSVAPAPPAPRVFTYGVTLYLALILLLAYGLDGPYVVRTSDSSMRMAIHVLPLGYFYAGLKLATLSGGDVQRAAVTRS